MARTDTLTNYLTDVASAIKTKKGDDTPILASNFDTEIANLPSGGGVDIGDYFQLDGDHLTFGGEIKKIPDDFDIESAITTMSSYFASFSQIKTIPLITTTNVTNMSYMFNNCSKLISIPAINTQNVTNMSYMFQSCNNFENLPILNTNKVTNFRNMFTNCRKLTNESLDNILQMCINATSYNSTKTLLYMGISSSYYSASLIQSLPHYQSFVNAGWSIGY